jgi:hypothetical protein
MKLVLLESDNHQRRDQTPVVAGVVYKVYRGDLRLTENSVYLMEGPEGTEGRQRRTTLWRALDRGASLVWL